MLVLKANTVFRLISMSNSSGILRTLIEPKTKINEIPTWEHVMHNVIFDHPTEHFKILELRNPSINVFYVVKNGQSKDCEV